MALETGELNKFNNNDISIWQAIEKEYEKLINQYKNEEFPDVKTRYLNYQLNHLEHYEGASLKEITYRYF